MGGSRDSFSLAKLVAGLGAMLALALFTALSARGLEKRVRGKVLERCLASRSPAECGGLVELRSPGCFERLHDRKVDSINFDRYERCVLATAEDAPDAATPAADAG